MEEEEMGEGAHKKTVALCATSVGASLGWESNPPPRSLGLVVPLVASHVGSTFAACFSYPHLELGLSDWSSHSEPPISM